MILCIQCQRYVKRTRWGDLEEFYVCARCARENLEAKE